MEHVEEDHNLNDQPLAIGPGMSKWSRMTSKGGKGRGGGEEGRGRGGDKFRLKTCVKSLSLA